MTLKIESRIPRGKHAGETQTPWRDKDGFYIVSSERFEKLYIRVADLESVGNALASGLRVRMKAANQDAAGLVKPTSIKINGLPVSDWQQARKTTE